MKKITPAIIICLLAVDIILAGVIFKNNYGGFGGDISRVCFKSKCFGAEVAATEAQRESGLMWRQTLGADKGMLFIYPYTGIYPFWMKNTLIPLDMVWLDQDRRVVFIRENAQPCAAIDCPLITPAVKAQYVFEANAGMAKMAGLKYGDKAEFFLYPER